MLEESNKFMPYRLTILGFEIVVFEKCAHVRPHNLRRSLPFPLNDLIDQVVGDHKPQGWSHNADANETIDGKSNGQAGIRE